MKTILVIEDEQEIREKVVKILAYQGFEAIGAENGRVGVQLAKQHLPDLIVCDVMMPELNGYRVLAAVRSYPATANTPFIFLTAKASKHDIREGMRLGADDYLPKPFTIDELLSAVTTRLERHEAQSHKMDDLRMSLQLVMPNEMRNALTGVLGFAELLMRPQSLPEPDDLAEIGKIIYDSGEKLQRLIENYIMYTELKLLEYQPTRTNDWLKQDVVNIQPVISFFSKFMAKKAGRTNDLVLDLVEVDMPFSVKSMHTIIMELLENAFEFSKEGTPVTVLTRVADDHLTLEVIDKGRGMNPQQTEYIGQSGQFAEHWGDQEGIGMGLMIARLLIELHGGALQVQSVLNQGTTVTVTFPLNA